MSARTFHNGRVTLHHGDCLAVLDTLEENSVDSVVCDPPYHLTSIVKRFGGENAAPARKGSADNATGAYARASAGFMGKQWDGGDIAFRSETWAKVMRVLKPGGHLVAFSGTRTYHRMAVAIEDAGFEIRDMLSWLYGTGFPKSHDVSKGIDKRRDWTALPRLQSAIGAARKRLGISQSEAARRMGLIGLDEVLGGGGFMWFETGMRAPTSAQWPQLKAALSIGDEFDQCFEEAEREVTGAHVEWTDRVNYALTSKDGLRRDKPASDAAREWEGWGTALKPACEPVCFARKPLSEGTVAANVLAHGTGAIHVDACRIATDEENRRPSSGGDNGLAGTSTSKIRARLAEEKPEGLGRWPANVIHDGSDEVVSAFPNTQSGYSDGTKSGIQQSVFGKYGAGTFNPTYGDAGSAARFFYSAKADADDRIKSKHPTVKPVDLMRWLVRLVTPPGGVVLDPFAGTGTTGAAAFYEGFRAILIEREAEYVTDITRRMDLLLAGPDEKARALSTSESADTLPLFGGAA